ncbi:MAG: UDP-N-acetylmuramoyl-L-alanyl-D-glutamate--2,6-diaminopimelate ligase [Bacteroidetes bacterium]|nr:UDP-N-acetylmuramoyl-L-alanyl-D-glutamate--2,6-diaminopimelate ligase [Rhodothermia bacterium]MCS7155864.1 UDP-N-acetylmuramoyl-L-alanyl-D-glutamate--2,6-diaminopimelate ligase [Bacteroidota bacterium]MCX7906035.1 UDP-N-acetylmuramoyl-L-alanyl-D-glutamate--2,6-diaminopimelate ligase [Bacteroidota bacterium]MDW8138163.1 UDP-N-acetylmuramoyl-L-alanyl-D-glutamate--2,6-diaminopimelate ligase [Bacteroidota bacterium]MDW8285847.1 UDP-N-acetylmuramoyl-L-alanyl-D-glutamate--2,6-diaminopimelate ligas
MQLRTLLATVEVLRAEGELEQEVRDLVYDSRRVRPGSVFVALRGTQLDGHRFVEAAIRQGAVAVVVEVLPEARAPGVAYIQVPHTRRALAQLAAAYYGHPERRLRLVGVTGTNGKTTTTHLIQYALQQNGIPAGLIGTVRYDLVGEAQEAVHTTPESVELYGLLARIAQHGGRAAVMEVSSHALDQDRVWGLPFQVAVFTNLSRDHLDYHGSMEAYFAAKKKLFDGLRPEAVAVYNADDPHGPAIVADTPARRVVSYGLQTPAAYRAEVLEQGLSGIRLRVGGRSYGFRLVGRFNVYNLLAAWAAAVELGLEAHQVLAALSTCPSVRGRLERVRSADGVIGIVDYAHTPDALENVLRVLRAECPADGRLWVVFGCGGDRDRGKRPTMGQIAERYADRVVLTSDNPRTEDPEAIVQEILAGMAHPERVERILDRREAIRFAALEARSGDVVLVAGKGHETYQVIGHEKRPFDDRWELEQAFRLRSGATGR